MQKIKLVFEVKQVILIRKDLRNTKGEKITKGKYCSQAAHATTAVILKMMKKTSFSSVDGTGETWSLNIYNNTPLSQWLNDSFTKVCLAVNSEKELLDLHQQAKDLGLISALIQDNGLTEFGGIKTYTTCSIGPAYSEEIDKITKHLSLFT